MTHFRGNRWHRLVDERKQRWQSWIEISRADWRRSRCIHVCIIPRSRNSILRWKLNSLFFSPSASLKRLAAVHFESNKRKKSCWRQTWITSYKECRVLWVEGKKSSSITSRSYIFLYRSFFCFPSTISSGKENAYFSLLSSTLFFHLALDKKVPYKFIIAIKLFIYSFPVFSEKKNYECLFVSQVFYSVTSNHTQLKLMSKFEPCRVLVWRLAELKTSNSCCENEFPFTCTED